MDWQITGHRNQIQLLEKALKNGKLAHAYVFAGPEGVGKRTIAKKLAWEMLSEGRVGSVEGEDINRFHPDFLDVSAEGGVKIEQIRELTYKLSLMPYQAKYKVALIDDADQMTIEASNALLKTLEEPKDYTFIFLITSNPNRLPKTILSRCQKITFGPVDLPKEETEEKIRATEFFEIFINGKQVDKLISAYDLAGLETGEVKKILETWMTKLEALLLKNPTKLLANKISQVMLARKFLEQNVNSKLLLTNLMLSTS